MQLREHSRGPAVLSGRSGSSVRSFSFPSAAWSHFVPQTALGRDLPHPISRRDLCGSGRTAGSELPGGHSGGLLGPAGWLPFAGAGRTAVSGRWFASRLRAVPHWVFWSHTFQFK